MEFKSSGNAEQQAKVQIVISEMVSRICHLLMNDVLDAIFNQIMQVSDPTVRNNLCRAFCTL